MKLPSFLRERLKIPLGRLVLDRDISKENLQTITANLYVITVGDRTTERLIEFGIFPSLQIIDGLEKRVKRETQKFSVSTELECKNPPAEITIESIETIKEAFTCKTPVRIKVIGEEDLLVLPVCVYAPENSIVMYGQPNEGLVIVPITPEIRNKTQGLLDSMK